MFLPAASPSPDRPLPWPARPAGAARGRVGHWPLDPRAVAHFDAVLHRIHPQAPRVDADRLATLGRWLLDLPSADARAVLDVRLARMEALRAMLADPDWDRRDAVCARVRTLLAYLDQGADVIPDAIPLLGLLDDVLLLELAWPVLATEAEDYQDFCDYRAAARPPGDGAARREAWIRDRLEALALFQHQARVHASRYAWGGHPQRPFRVG
jgi:uncharacterized membrane protein YkvA (DUF1232 family)